MRITYFLVKPLFVASFVSIALMGRLRGFVKDYPGPQDGWTGIIRQPRQRPSSTESMCTPTLAPLDLCAAI
jgi:hypothetical protein